MHCAELEGGYQNTGKNRPGLQRIEMATDMCGWEWLQGKHRPHMRKAKNATLETKRTLQVYNKRRKNKKNNNMKMQEHILIYNYNNPLGTNGDRTSPPPSCTHSPRPPPVTLAQPQQRSICPHSPSTAREFSRDIFSRRRLIRRATDLTTSQAPPKRLFGRP